MWVIGISIVLIAVLGLFGLLHKTKDIRSNIDPSTMEIKIGEVKSISPVPNLSIKVLDVTEDSRCPAGYECAQIGWATVRIEVTFDGVTVTKDISTTGGTKPSEVSVGDKVIRLVNINPTRTSPDAIKKSAYEVTFFVASSTPTGTKSKGETLQ